MEFRINSTKLGYNFNFYLLNKIVKFKFELFKGIKMVTIEFSEEDQAAINYL